MQNKNNRSEDKNNTFLGGIVTIIYLLIVLYYIIYINPSFFTMTPNEFGDFLAGTFSPLALFWLVLGYRQQAHELRLARLEYANTVEQFGISNEISKKRLSSELQNREVEKIEKEEERYRELNREAPRISLHKKHFGKQNGKLQVGIWVKSSSGFAYNFQIMESVFDLILESPLIASNALAFEFEIPDENLGSELTFELEYFSEKGLVGVREKFLVSLLPASPQKALIDLQIEGPLSRNIYEPE